MNVREHLLALNDELRRLKAGGQRTVSITEEHLAELRAAVQVALAESQPAGGPVPSSPASLPGRHGDVLGTPAVAAFFPSPAPTPAPTRATPAAAAASQLPPPPTVQLPEGDKAARWQALRELVLRDAVCNAHVFPGKKIVFGVGSLDAAVMFVGEAPGADEEDQGEPFVGRAGQLLNRMIKAMGLERGQVYIGNILNWRPEMPRNPDGSQTGNRPPTAAEMGYCLPFIRAQIEIIRPRVLVALGKTAVDGLLGADRFKSLGAARGAWHEYGGLPLRATYHPSYLLRQEGLTSVSARKIKRDAWEDILHVMERAGVPISEKQRNYFL